MPPAIITILIRCAAHHPQWGQQGPRLPGGGAGRPNGLTEGVWFVECHQPKVTDYTPFAAVAALPPKGAAREPRLPGGGAVEQSETEGVLFVEWHQPKVTNYTPFAANAALPPKGAARAQ